MNYNVYVCMCVYIYYFVLYTVFYYFDSINYIYRKKFVKSSLKLEVILKI